ncbi:hypothetical protein JCM17823_25610 [Halorubrum gandharaense]
MQLRCGWDSKGQPARTKHGAASTATSEASEERSKPRESSSAGALEAVFSASVAVPTHSTTYLEPAGALEVFAGGLTASTA